MIIDFHGIHRENCLVSVHFKALLMGKMMRDLGQALIHLSPKFENASPAVELL